jgi:uncharacterized Tic20 family protein
MSNPYAAPVQPMSPTDERLWATLVHLSGFLLSFIGALIGFLVLGDRGPFVRAHSAAALNFQISLAIYSAALTLASFITLGFASLLFVPLGIAAVVFMILAAVAANRGQYYTYPLTIAFVK